jgi:hypothetical protein
MAREFIARQLAVSNKALHKKAFVNYRAFEASHRFATTPAWNDGHRTEHAGGTGLAMFFALC